MFYPDELNHFLDEIFDKLDMKISIKTRSGKYEQDEFEELLDIYNHYPLEELILHSRVQQDYYKNRPDWTTFAYAFRNSKNPLVYNGDIFVWKITKPSTRNSPKQNASCSEEEF